MDVWAHFAEQAPDLSGENPDATRERLTREKARKWILACEHGRCRYSGLRGSDEKALSGDEGDAERCGGYRGIRHLEHGKEVWRWTICDRHRAWWESRRAYVRSQKPQKKRGGYEEEC